MSPQESQVLQQFLQQLVQANGLVKDKEAQALIEKAVAQQPDAAYLLVQRVLLQDQALNVAQGQIAQLKIDLEELRASRSAQGSGAFLDASSAWGNSASSRPLAAATTYAPTPPSYSAAPPTAFAAAPAQPGFLSGQGGSMLGTMAATAAGVAAGAFLFQGIGSLMGHHGSGASLDSSGASAAPAGSANTDSGLIKDYFATDTLAQSDADSGGLSDLGSFDDSGSNDV